MNDFHHEDEEEEIFCRFTFGQFVSLALLELVALFFVFYLGARYGPDLLGQKDQVIDANLHTLPTDEVIPIKEDEVKKEGVIYTYPEALTRKERETVAAIIKKEIKTDKKKVKTEKKAVQKLTSGQAAFSVQVGSYRKASGASQKINQWQAKGYDAFMSIGVVPNQGTWYRVRIGSFSTRKGAKKFLDQLTQREQVKAIIVRNQG